MLEWLIVPPLYAAGIAAAGGVPGFWTLTAAVFAGAIRGAVCTAAVSRAALGRVNPIVLAVIGVAAGLSVIAASQLKSEFVYCMVEWADPLTRWGVATEPSPVPLHWNSVTWNHYSPFGGWAWGRSLLGDAFALLCPLLLLPMVPTPVPRRARDTVWRALGLLGVSGLWLAAFHVAHTQMWRLSAAAASAHAAGERVTRGQHTAIEIELLVAVTLAGLYAVALTLLLQRFARSAGSGTEHRRPR